MALEIQILKKDENRKYYIKEAHPCTLFMKGIYLCSFKYGSDKLSLLYDSEKNNLRIGTSKGYEDYNIKQKEIKRFLKGNYYICIAEPVYVDYTPSIDSVNSNSNVSKGNGFDKFANSSPTLSV